LQQSETSGLNGKKKEIEKERLKISSPKTRQAVFCFQKPYITAIGIVLLNSATFLLNSSTSVFNKTGSRVKHGS
jgi:hypothetical protein